MSALTVRRAVSGDLRDILRLLADDHLGRDRDDPANAEDAAYREAFAAIDADPNQFLGVAELDGAVVGTFQLSFLPGLSNRGALKVAIEAVRVDSALRGGGYGGQMLSWAMDYARGRGCSGMQLKSHRSREGAHRFYERHGFRHSHVGMTRPL
ncbi:GNAT family N-acetyltransferase [Pelagovum pacificum]|uniref:GNAT family N-acetyltransferase n=1 Tax=Pelagovum pacificum TaxID=2588711 RepID=UPI0018CD8AC8|nr:GNAT family N-acetyltransferase [Pelagovum pacificum]QQA45066.1 GNAT family N-acetyltransferase [Pelagovum pacificum]